MSAEESPLIQKGTAGDIPFSPESAKAIRAARVVTQPTHSSIINDLMDVVPYGRVQHRLLLSAAFTWMCMGMMFNADALALSELQAVYKMTDFDAGGLVSTIAAGILAGASIAGMLSDWYGRKPVILVGILCMAAVGFGKALAPTRQWQLALRFIQGLSTSCIWIPLPCLVAEQMPKSVRGPFTIIYSAGWPLGALICALVGQWLLPTRWQAFYVLTTMPIIFAGLLIACLTHESPRFLVSAHCNRKAVRGITAIYNENGHYKPAQLEMGVWDDAGDMETPPRRSKSAKKRENGHGSSLDGRLSWCGQLFGSWGHIAIYLVWLACSAASWGSTFWMPSYIERRVKLDALVVMTNADTTPNEANLAAGGGGTTTPFRMLIFTSLCDAVGIALSAKFVDRLGRIFIMKLGFATSGISLVVLTWVTGEIWVLTCAGIMQFSQSLTWTVVSLYTLEAFVSNIRSTAMGISNAVAKVGSIVAPLMCGYLMQDNIHDAMLLCAGMYGTGWLISFMLSPDRTGKKLPY